jgi:hypothetical protein
MDNLWDLRWNGHYISTEIPQIVEILGREECFWSGLVTDYDEPHHSNTRNVPQVPRIRPEEALPHN